MHPEESPLFVTALARGLQILTAFRAGHPSMNLPEIVAATGLNKSAAQRFAFTLETLGYLRKEPQSKRYRLTPRALELGFGYLQTDDLIERANPYLHDLNRQLGESCSLSRPDGTDMVFVARFPSQKQISIHMPVGRRLPIFCTASGRAYLSRLGESEARTLLEASTRVAYTGNTVTDLDRLLELIGKAGEDGYAYANEEFYLGDISIAAPIVDASGFPLGAINISAPSSRWQFADACRELGPLVIGTARAVSGASLSMAAGRR